MRLIAHRGFASINPENTRRAVEEAAAMADAIEVDVRRCGSGELVVIHDATVDRVSDGTGRVADLSLAELADLNVLGTGEGVPTLAAIAEAVPPTIGLNIELKEPDIAADALAVTTDVHPQVIVSSFLPQALRTSREAEPSVPRALITGENPDSAIERARALECEYLHPAVEICSESLVTTCHRSGMSVNAWTVDNRSEAETLEELGVDGIIADRWGVLPEATQ